MYRTVRLIAFLFAAAVSLRATAIAQTCSSISVAPLNFGSNIVPGGAGVTIKTVTSIVYNCTTSFSLSLSDANATGFQLSGTAGSLTYGLFQDSARTIPWGNGT